MAKNIWHTTDPTSAGFQAAGNWYGVMTAFYSVAALLWGLFYAKTKANQRKFWYGFGLFADAISIIIVALTGNKWVALLAFALYGIGNFTINTLPFTILTSSLHGENEGGVPGVVQHCGLHATNHWLANQFRPVPNGRQQPVDDDDHWLCRHGDRGLFGGDHSRRGIIFRQKNRCVQLGLSGPVLAFNTVPKSSSPCRSHRPRLRPSRSSTTRRSHWSRWRRRCLG